MDTTTHPATPCKLRTGASATERDSQMANQNKKCTCGDKAEFRLSRNPVVRCTRCVGTLTAQEASAIGKRRHALAAAHAASDPLKF